MEFLVSEPVTSPDRSMRVFLASSSSLTHLLVESPAGEKTLMVFDEARVDINMEWLSNEALAVSFSDGIVHPLVDEGNERIGPNGSVIVEYFAVPASEIVPVSWSPLPAATEDDFDIEAIPQARGTILIYRNQAETGYAYDYIDALEEDAHDGFFEKRGMVQGGEVWAMLVKSAVSLECATVHEGIDTDADAEGLRVWGRDLKTLEVVAALVQKLKSDSHFFEHALAHGLGL